MGWRERVQWVAHQALLLFILIAVAFLSAITAMRFAIQGREVEMPRIVGAPVGNAQAVLGSRQLGMRIADHIYNELPRDTVVRQSPPPGTRVKVGQRAHVIVSLGPQQVTVPELEGKSMRAARIEIMRSGLQVGEVSSAYLGETEAGMVLKQFPPPAAKGASPRVNLLVAQGARANSYVMPNLVGLFQPEAQHRLSAAGLHIAKVTPATLTAALPGTVVAQTPPRGARVAADTPIELQVVQPPAGAPQ
jgi:serine/threonine-protein kinase